MWGAKKKRNSEPKFKSCSKTYSNLFRAAMKPERDLRLAQLIEQELLLILPSAENPILNMLTVSEVIPEKGGKHFLILLQPEEAISTDEINKHLQKAKGYLRTELALSLNLKKCPDFTFRVSVSS